MEQCQGIKKDGIRCSTMVLYGVRCGVHMRTLEKVGPNAVRRMELKFIHDRNMMLIEHEFSAEVAGTARGTPEYQVAINNHNRRKREVDLAYRGTLIALDTKIHAETLANDGVDADQPYQHRQQEQREAARRARMAAWEARMAERNQRLRARDLNNQQPAAAIGRDPDDLRGLAADRQNVHTALVVNKVKETVQTLLQIVVPDDYQTDTLKTPGEIILECGLSKNAAWQMMSQYCTDAPIYELGNGIYARVLNSVWQYIKSSPDSADLKRILASEMTDNIGMCAQGNLSRLCNILSGYLDGINVETKSTNEILGEKFSSLLDIENLAERQTQAERILADMNVPHDQWHAWVNPLVEA